MKKQILLLVIIIAVTGVVSGCRKKTEEIVDKTNNGKMAKGQNQVSTLLEKENIPKIGNLNSDTILASSTKNMDISDWLLYKGDNYGFEINYPKEWSLENSSDGISIFSKNAREGYPEGGGDVSVKIENKSLMQFVDEYNKSDRIGDIELSKIIKQEKIILSGVDSVKMTGTTAIGINESFIYLIFKDRNYLISYHDFDDFHRKIISTIKFVK